MALAGLRLGPAADTPGRAFPVDESAATVVQDALYRALAVVRLAVLVNAIVLFTVRSSRFDHPRVGFLVLGLLALWTLIALWAYDDVRRRTSALLVVDLLVAVATMVSTPYVKGAGWNATLPGFAVMGVVLAWAVAWRWQGGLVAGVVVAGLDFGLHEQVVERNWGNQFLLLLGGLVVGFLSGLLQQMAAERDRAERASAVAEERQRIARAVHDETLQVLALVQRRGVEMGGEAAELGRLAGEQEVALRALVQGQSVPATRVADAVGVRDLGELLGPMATPTVSVALPGTPCWLPAPVATEMAAVVAACLSNVRHHVGPHARAWVLLEDLGSAQGWAVSVRDEGPGIPDGRLAQAASQGRLGVAQSIRGRVTDLGGSATLTTAPGSGVEWEFLLPATGTEAER